MGSGCGFVGRMVDPTPEFGSSYPISIIIKHFSTGGVGGGEGRVALLRGSIPSSPGFDSDYTWLNKNLANVFFQVTWRSFLARALLDGLKRSRALSTL